MRHLYWRIAAAYGGLAALVQILLGAYLMQQKEPTPEHIGIAVVGAFALSVLLGTGLAVVVARTTTKPLAELTRAVRQLATGLSSAPRLLTVEGDDEVNELTRALDAMVIQLQQQMRVLEEGRAGLETLVTHMADGLIIVDHNEIVQVVNPAAASMLELTPNAVVGRSAATALRDHELVAVVREAAVSAPPQLVDIGPLEHRRTLQVVASPLAEGAGGHRRVLVLLQDVTELRRTEVLRREFVANVSHELRTPVAVLKALSETLADGALDDPPAAHDFVQRMQVEVDGLAQLVEELFALSRIESGRLPLHLETIDLRQVVRRAAERIRPQAERARVTLTVDDGPAVATVRADPERIEQIIVNLVHNAVKFTPPGGHISVTTGTTAPDVLVSVADDGIGIPAEAVPRLFERFYKVDRSRRSGGTGLGLAIVKHLVQAQGGRIWAESPGEGRGATFWVSLPHARQSES